MTGTSQAAHPAAQPALSSPLRLIVAHAGPVDEAARQALAGLRLPHLSQLLARLAPRPEASAAGTGPGAAPPARSDDSAGLHPELSLSLPHELALARALGLPARDGHLPWAAWREAVSASASSRGDARSAATRENADAVPATAPPAFARFTPCQWAVGSDHIALRDPEALHLSDEESQALLAAMQPYFTEDALAVRWDAALAWTARGEMLRDLPCASLDRVVGRRVDDWLPRTPSARPIRRLQQEMQMLLYTHPVNEARERRGLLPVNSFWVDRAGALPGGWTPAASATALLAQPEVARPGADVTGIAATLLHLDAPIRLDERLRRPALQADAAAWAAAWQALDAEALPPLLAALDAGRRVELTLAGERRATTFTTRAGTGLTSTITGAITGLVARWRAPAPAHVLDTL